MPAIAEQISRHQSRLRQCKKCPQMTGPVVMGEAVASSVMLIGQAPGNKEIEVGRPFAWTAGKTLFKWFESIGMPQTRFRERVYMAAVCRCFPGKNPKGGDRVPDPREIDNCSAWLRAELKILRPRLILPVGKLAIAQLLTFNTLNEVVGTTKTLELPGFTTDVIALPHPSGASVWHRVEPGKTLLRHALQTVARHPAWKALCA